MPEPTTHVNNIPIDGKESFRHSACVRENTIQMPKVFSNRLFKVRFADSQDNPKVSSTVLIRGAVTVMDAAAKALKTEGWRAFQSKYPDAWVSGCEYAGEVEAIT